MVCICTLFVCDAISPYVYYLYLYVGIREKSRNPDSSVETKMTEIDMLLKELYNGRHSQGDEIATFEKVGCTDSLEVEMENNPVVCCSMEGRLE